MTENELKQRTKKFAIAILKMVDKFSNKRSGYIIANQLGRSASSVAANYRAACRARSKADFISKISIVEEEADETVFWLELSIETDNAPYDNIKTLLTEANELTAIFTASCKTAKANKTTTK